MAFDSSDLFSNKTSAPIVGTASVIDGDTINIDGNRIRFYGVDTPESDQVCQDASGYDYQCGQSATRALSDKIGHQEVSCERKDVDRYGRTVAVCYVGDVDLNGWLVSEGLAVAYYRYSARYGPEEIAARIAGRGLWAGSFDHPEDWRHSR